MNPSAILTLISDLYTTISTQTDHIKKLEAALAERAGDATGTKEGN